MTTDAQPPGTASHLQLETRLATQSASDKVTRDISVVVIDGSLSGLVNCLKLVSATPVFSDIAFILVQDPLPQFDGDVVRLLQDCSGLNVTLAAELGGPGQLDRNWADLR